MVPEEGPAGLGLGVGRRGRTDSRRGAAGGAGRRRAAATGGQMGAEGRPAGAAREAGARPRARAVAAGAGRRRPGERRCLWSCRLRWNYEK